MHVEQIYTKCLAQGAYYLHSDGEAAIIDPLREIEPYLEKLKADGTKLKYIFETHFHADFVSGHVTLAEKTGATIIYGPQASTSYKSRNALDGELFTLGKATIKALHTPGHTVESTSYLLRDEQDEDCCIFTGDTLFLGDVGRPDLCQKGSDITEDDLAGMLYDSLRDKIMPLDDKVKVYPAHGAGSACGKSMMKITVDSLGNQKAVNYALRADMTKSEFIKEVTEGLSAAPAYFPENVRLNREGYEHIDEILSQGLTALSSDAFEETRNAKKATILDVRDKESFRDNHIPGSIFIGLDGSFAPWVGAILKDVNRPILIVTPEGREEETITRLSRVGFDNTLGYLKGGIAAWKQSGKKVANVKQITAEQVKSMDDINLYDCRKPGEYDSAHLEGVSNVPLSQLELNMTDIPKDKASYIHCQSGYRSMIATSLLMAAGYEHITDVAGGFNALKETGMKLVELACPSTMN